MDNFTLLVLAKPTDAELKMLDQLPEATNLAVGDEVEAFERIAPDADVILHWSASGFLLEKVFRIAPRVRWIHSRAAGLDALLFPGLVESPVPLTNGSGVFSRSLGEFVAAAALYFAKDFRRMTRNQEAGRWEQFDIEEVYGKTMGIVGYGDIGRAAAERAKALGMRVLALRRRPEKSQSDPLVDEVLPPERLLELMRRSDYVVAAAPLTAQTAGLIGAPEIAAMKPTGVLMNVGRGPVIAEEALVAALRERRIRGAALDVFCVEPLPEGHPYYGLDNVLLSPHCADHTPEWLEDAMRFFLENFARFAKGEPLRNVVEKRLGY